MNIQDLGALGELVSAVVVVVTLIYLASQLKQNALATRSATHHSVTTAMSRINSSLSQPHLAKAFAKANKTSFAELEADEAIMVAGMLTEILKIYEDAYYQYKKGNLEESSWEGGKNYIIDVFSMPFAQEWISTPRAHWFSQEFLEFLNNNRREGSSYLQENIASR